jgi:thiol-disulfide isomerase/thioredoxin
LGEILISFSPLVKQTTVYLEIKNFYDTQVALEQRTPAFNYSEEIEDINIEFDAENVIQTLVGLNPGKPIYLKIWGSWCVPCKKEFPHIRELQSKITTNDLVFAYFCVLSPEQDWRMLIKEEGLKGQHFLMSKELSEALLAKLQDRTVPKYVLIDKNGSIIDMNAPKPSDDRIFALLNEMIE